MRVYLNEEFKLRNLFNYSFNTKNVPIVNAIIMLVYIMTHYLHIDYNNIDVKKKFKYNTHITKS